MTTDSFADQLIASENKIENRERSCTTSRSEPEITEGFANDLDTLQHDGKKLKEDRNEIGSEVELRFTRVADQIERVEVHMATVPGNDQLLNSRIRPHNAKKTKVSRIMKYIDNESASSDEHRDDSAKEYESNSSNAKEEDTRRGRKGKPRKEVQSNRPKKLTGSLRSVVQCTLA